MPSAQGRYSDTIHLVEEGIKMTTKAERIGAVSLPKCQTLISIICLLVMAVPGIGYSETAAVIGDEKVGYGEESDSRRLDIRKGRTPKIDGIATPGEWEDAGSVRIFVRQGWQVTVRYKHDGSNLYFGFTDMADPDKVLIRVPEVVFDMKNDKTPSWNEDDWWFHASGRDCHSQGRFNDYKTCMPEATGWEANNQRGMVTPEIFEIRISYTYIGLKPGRGTKIGLAINVTDTKTSWNFWPQGATLEKPMSWGEAISSDGW
jgi:hypothetical protein